MSNKSNDYIVKKPAPTNSKGYSSATANKQVAPITNSSSYNKSTGKSTVYSYGSRNVYKNKFKKAFLHDYEQLKDVIDLYEDCIVTKLPGGKYIEVYFDGEDFHYSTDSIAEGHTTTHVYEYLNKNIYPELSKIIKNHFSDIPCHFYALLGRKGFHIYDIFINENFLDFEDVEKVTKGLSERIKTPEVIYDGIYLNASEHMNRKSFLIRPTYDSVDTEDHFVAMKES